MRAISALPVLITMLLVPATAAAQTTMYVCTPAKQILKVVDGPGLTVTTTVLYSNSLDAPYDDCVVGPEGLLYVSSGSNILALNPLSLPSNAVATPAVATLPPAAGDARGLAFNVTTLYINSASGGVFTLAAGTLSNPAAIPLGSSGRGAVFNVVGSLIFASGATVRSAPPPYSSSTALVGPSGSPLPFGVAVDTCKQIVFADASTNTIQRVTGSGPVDTGVSFADDDEDEVEDIPRYIEVASNNDMFIVTSDEDFNNGKIWRAHFVFATHGSVDCSSTPTTTKLVDLVDAFDSSGSAIGIALAPTHHDITKTFSATQCTNDYDFGYHRVRLTFTNCAAAFASITSADINVEALKSTLAEVDFASGVLPNPLPSPPIEGMRYSAMGGFPVQYQFTLLGDGENPPPALFPTPMQMVFFFNTQEIVKRPGVARGDDGIGTQYRREPELRLLGRRSRPGRRARGRHLQARRVQCGSTCGAGELHSGIRTAVQEWKPAVQRRSECHD